MFLVTVTHKQMRRRVRHESGPIEIGRIEADGAPRIVVDDPFISRHQLRLEPTASQTMAVENLSAHVPIVDGDGRTIAPGAKLEIALPARLTIGATTVELEWVAPASTDSTSDEWRTIRAPTFRADVVDRAATQMASLVVQTDNLSPETLAHWFEVLISVQRAAAGSSEFYQETAAAVVQLIGLDCGMVLLRRQGATPEWEVVASHAREGVADDHRVSQTILRRVVSDGCTLFRAAEALQQTASLQGVEAAVASPILDHNDNVVGAVYGIRLIAEAGQRPGIRPIEAQLVQVLAAATGAGLARLEREAEAARARVQFEQFFSEQLAQKLEREPNLLEGRDRTVTVLFSDIRGFSRLSERLGPTAIFRLVGDVMDRLTACVVASDGMVDYLGDGLLAMWNAPDDHADHAMRACRAAVAMLRELPALNERWSAELGAPIALGIGVNTGPARVGNTGSRRRFKYGPLGHAVNLASRVEGSTKHWRLPALITQSTRDAIGDQWPTRRLGQMQMPGMEGAVNIYELALASDDEQWRRRRDAYEAGLAHFEAGRWSEAYQVIAPLAADAGGRDIPSLLLLERTIHCLTSRPEKFDPVIHLASK